MTKKRMPWGVTIALMAITAAVTISLTYQFAMEKFNQSLSSLSERQAMYSKLDEVDRKVRENFYGSIDEQNLNDSIAAGYVSGLGDAHSYYLTVEEYNKMQNELAGKTVGIGIETQLRASGELMVVRVYANSPAALAGIQKGDVIVAVGDVTMAQNGYQAVREALVGEDGQQVTVTIHRGDEEKQELAFDVTRGQFEIASVESRVTAEGFGYIRITEFNDNTPDQFEAALTQLQQQNVAGLILDLRNNPGGSLASVASILDTILPAGNIVSSEDKNGNQTVLYTSDAAQLSLPIAVLVNGNSASAAELMACAIRDYKKGTLIGENTYGKGTMQQTFALTDGSAVSITIAKFNPPLSENFDGTGLMPDLQVSLTEEQKERFYFLSDAEDSQLKAAISRLLNETGMGAGAVSGDGVSSSSGQTASASSESVPAAESITEEPASSQVETVPSSEVAAYEADAKVTAIF